jgi:rhodanese-related sulfurtransferase
VQATDRYVATLRSTIVLVDDNTIRAIMTASWINQLGLHDAVVLERGLLDATLLRGVQPSNALGLDDLHINTTDPLTLSQHIRAGTAAVVDVERSLAFRRGHIPGAVHAVRGHLHERLDALPGHECLALTSSEGMLARYCVEEAAALTDADVVVLDGGNQAWTDAGLALEQGSEGLEASPTDAFLRPYDNDRSVEEAMQSYLDWEIALLDKMDVDGTVAFRTA